MPIYEYFCEKCEKTFEAIVSISFRDTPACKDCGSADTRKIMSATSITSQGKSSQPAGCQPRGGFS